ncbi:MAG: YceI family protein [Chloroflexota bacterium]|nr:YceI family protein [Chloroflexota bacterium]
MKNIQKVIALGALVVVVVLGVVAFSVLRAPEEASAPIEAIPLAQSSAVATSSAAGAEVESSPAADEVEAEAAASTAASAASGSSAGSSAAASTATDSEFRDRAIKNRILNTDQYEFVTFTPMQIVGLPANGSVGQSYSFQIIGDLTVRDVTKPVTFDVTATPISETRLEGTAQTTIRYADFGLTIPQVRQVASVSEQVRLEIDFVAVPR